MSVLVRENHDAVVVLRLHRPEKHNALNLELRNSLEQQFLELQTSPECRVVILTGAGKSFCSGLDLGDLHKLRQQTMAENRQDAKQLARLFEMIYQFPKPVIAAVNGHAIAGGAGLASVCDMTIMNAEAKTGYTEARLGFIAALVGVFLVRQVGEKLARELLLTARLLSASEAKAVGLVNEVVPEDLVLTRALEVAKLMANNAPSSLDLSKQLLASVQSMGLAEALNYAVELNALSRTSADLQEGVNAFLEKRSPIWS